MLLEALPSYKSAEVAPSAVHLAWAVNGILCGAGGGGDSHPAAPLVKEFLPHTAVLFDGSLAKSFGTRAFEEAVEQVRRQGWDLGWVDIFFAFHFLPQLAWAAGS